MTETLSGFSDRTKSLAILLPIVATSLAVTYDVGYFLGLGLRYFSFFSLSEHLVFALQATPFAAAVTLMVAGYPIGYWIGSVRADAEVKTFLAGLTGKSETERQIEIDKQVLQWRAEAATGKWKWTERTVGALFVVFSISVHAYATALGFSILLLFIQGFGKQIAEILPRAAIMGLIAIMAILLAFTLGIERSTQLLSTKEAYDSISLEGETLSANIVRAGEKGLLIVQPPDKRIRFIRWESIKGIGSR